MAEEYSPQLFRSLAEKELATAIACIPSNPNQRFVLLLEILRELDYWTTVRRMLPEEHGLSMSDFQILYWGWNLAISKLLVPLKVIGGIPVRESSPESRSFARTLLHQLGRSVLMHRAAELIQNGYMTAVKNDDRYSLRAADFLSSQFLDLFEPFEFEKIKKAINQTDREMYNDWRIFSIEKRDQIKDQVGNFFACNPDTTFEDWKQPEIDSMMDPLVRPWISGHGMVDYDFTPQTLKHFCAEALSNAAFWRDEAGIHPQSKIGENTGAEIITIATLIAALHLQHIQFTLLGAKKYKEISIAKSLTLWGPVEGLVRTVAEFTGMHFSRAQKALDVIALHSHEAHFLSNHNSPFMPLLINLGNGLFLRPVSSLVHNPLFSVSVLNEWRTPGAAVQISEPRESWLRQDIHYVFQGTRYTCIDGNIKIRSEGKLVTDIDCAVFDRTTGELALFQLKWQDFFTNDVRKLRSKFSNLTNELNQWADQITVWLTQQGSTEISNTFRLSSKKNASISAVFLFAISRSLARVHGYGYELNNQNLAVATLPQFKRVRTEVGPSKRVFHDIHKALKSEASKEIKPNPIPVELKVAGQKIRFENLWNSFE